MPGAISFWFGYSEFYSTYVDAALTGAIFFSLNLFFFNTLLAGFCVC